MVLPSTRFSVHAGRAGSTTARWGLLSTLLRTSLGRSFLAGAAALTFGSAAAGVAYAEPVHSAPAAATETRSAAAAQALTLQEMERALFERTNANRMAQGLAPLAFDTDLLDVARVRAGAQVTLPRLSHTDQTGRLAIRQLLAAGAVPYGLAGENLARLPGAPTLAVSPSVSAVAERAEAALMDSPTHRKNILETRFTSVAIGAVADPSGRVIFAQIFRGV